MENLSEKGKMMEKKASGIKEERFKMLRGKYQKPVVSDFPINEILLKGSSSMASCFDASWAG